MSDQESYNRARKIERSLDVAKLHLLEVSHSLNDAAGFASFEMEGNDERIKSLQGTVQLAVRGLIEEHQAWARYAEGRGLSI